MFDSNHTQNMEQHRGRGRPPGSKATLPVDPKVRKLNRKVGEVEEKTLKSTSFLLLLDNKKSAELFIRS